MSQNPYLHDADNDDDVFTTSGHTHVHTFDNKPCRKLGCGVTHDVRLKNNLDLPPEVAEQLSKLLDTVPKDIVDHAVIVAGPAEEDMHEATKKAFLRFAHIVKAMNANAPMTLALFDVLDEQTNGSVTRHYKVYKAEADLINMHVIKDTLDTFTSWLHGPDPDPKPNEDAFRALQELDVFISERLEHYAEEYRQACINSDMPIDTSVVETGKPSSDRPLALEIMYDNLKKEIGILFEGKLIPESEFE